MAKDPAFLFYSSDFLTGTMTMTMQERGQFITILCALHQKGRLSLEHIKLIIREPLSDYVMMCFKQDEKGLFYNKRLDEECEKRKKFSESRRNSLLITNGDMVHLYLLFDPSTENYKIGSSKYPLMRLTELQKKNPKISMFWKSEILVERIKEKELHDHFQNKRVLHDWFCLDESDLIFIINKYRTGIRTEERTIPRTENENINENEIKNVIEYIGITAKKILTEIEVLNYWKAFKYQKNDFYNNPGELKKHFKNWLKKEILHGTTTNNSRTVNKQSGNNEVAERLAAKLAARGTADING